MADRDAGAPDSDESRPRTFTFRRTFTFGKPPPLDDPNVRVVEGPTKVFEWRLGDPQVPDDEPAGGLGGPPQTYYEAFTGRRDPQREFFVTARKWLNRGVIATALAFPVVGLAIGFLSGADLPTTLLLGFAGGIIGLMFKTSFPKTPFG